MLLLLLVIASGIGGGLYVQAQKAQPLEAAYADPVTLGIAEANEIGRAHV